MDHILSERRDAGVEVVTLNRPPMNALSAELLTELAGHAEALAGDAELRAVVLTGSRKVFAAGAEISQIQRNDGGPDLIDCFRRAFDAVAAIPRPVVAAISGYALGGGLEAAAACDVRLASESARLGVPEVHLGLFPGAGATQRLPRLIGASRAKELIWSGRTVRADEALAMGLVDRVVPVDGYLEAAVEWAASLGAGAAVAKALAKRAVDEGLERPLAQGLDLERELFREAIVTEDAATGIASFFEHGPGKANFQGR